MVYLPFSVEPSMLSDAVSAVRALNMAGVNLTIPHKEAVMEYLDEISDEARASSGRSIRLSMTMEDSSVTTPMEGGT